MFRKKENIIVLNSYMYLSGNKVIQNNFGDDLNYYLVKELSKKKIYNWSNFLHGDCENILCIGSIIENHVNKNSIIWGAGALYGGNKKLAAVPQKVLAVRGPLTRDFLIKNGVPTPENYGDPALLLPRIYNPTTEKKYKLGVIPHILDFQTTNYNNFIKKNGEEVKVFNFKKYVDWRQLVKEINECECIISSSLHGLIISDAYKIPNLWVKFSNRIEGGNFKYQDYFASVGRSVKTPIICDSKIELKEIFKLLHQYRPINYDDTQLLESCPFKIVR